jgi:hypothetical protein
MTPSHFRLGGRITARRHALEFGKADLTPETIRGAKYFHALHRAAFDQTALQHVPEKAKQCSGTQR